MFTSHTHSQKIISTAGYRCRFSTAAVLSWLVLAILLAGGNPLVAEVRRHEPYEPPTPEQDPNDPNVAALLSRWEKVTPGLHGSFASIDRRYARNLVPDTDGSMSWSGTAWRGERLGAQILLWTADGIEQVRFTTTPLRRKDGRQLPNVSMQPRFVRYALARGKQGCGRTPLTDPYMLLADILDTAKRLDMLPRSTRPIWVTINVPADTGAGLYRGNINITAKDGASLTFKIKLEVQAMTLPAPSEWSFHLDLWQNPWAAARYHRVQPWSKQHWDILEPLLRMLAKAGQKCVTTTIIHHPWGGPMYDPFESMVEWIRKTDGTWSFDYTIFDEYVKFCEFCGISRQINCYSMVPWTNRFRYLDEATGDYKFVEAKPGTSSYENHWRPFLKDFVKHLKDRGWLERTTIAMDERPLEPMQKFIEFVKKTTPELKISLAGGYHGEIKFDVYDLSIQMHRSVEPALIAERVERSLPTTFYTACVPPRPNNFIYSPPAESVWLGWHAASQGYTGYLRWAYAHWIENPLYDTSYYRWNSGDCFLVYPGPRSSIRFERLREGIVDYEKIRIIRQKLQQSNSPGAKKALKRLDEMLTRFSYESALKTPCAETVNAGKKLLTELSRGISGRRR